MSHGKVNFTALLREGCRIMGTLPMRALQEMRSSLIWDKGPRALLASLCLFIMPSDPWPERMTDWKV